MTALRAFGRLAALSALVTVSYIVTVAQAPNPQPVRFANVVDLTHALDEDTPYIAVPNITFPFRKTPIATIRQNGVAAYRWEIHEHLGTQIDAPNHFAYSGPS